LRRFGGFKDLGCNFLFIYKGILPDESLYVQSVSRAVE
jgi:hypothetical protein